MGSEVGPIGDGGRPPMGDLPNQHAETPSGRSLGRGAMPSNPGIAGGATEGKYGFEPSRSSGGRGDAKPVMQASTGGDSNKPQQEGGASKEPQGPPEERRTIVPETGGVFTTDSNESPKEPQATEHHSGAKSKAAISGSEIPSTQTKSTAKSSVDTDKTKETPRRPREVIKREMDATIEELSDLDEPFDNFLSSLPERIETKAVPYLERMIDEHMSEKDIEEQCPPDIVDVVKQGRSIFVETAEPVLRRLEGLKAEEVTYLREELDTAIDSTLPRLDYHKILNHFGNEEPRDNQDTLSNFVREMGWVRKYSYERTHAPVAEMQDHDYYTSALGGVTESKNRWERQGFLSEQPLRSENPSENPSEENNAELRREVVATAKEAVAQLGEYQRLAKIYKPRPRTAPEDPTDIHDHLRDVVRALDFESTRSSISEQSVEAVQHVDSDSAFLRATERHVKDILAEQGQAGRISKTSEELQAERKRIDAVDLDEKWSNVTFTGFEPPEGMVAIVTPEEIMENGKKFIPPDNVDNLRFITHAQAPLASGENIEDLGVFMPIFDEEGNLVTGELKVYANPFVPETATQEEKEYARTKFDYAFEHEDSHAAHYGLDYDEMKEWENIVKADDTAVTPYAQMSVREDFAESRGFMRNAPGLLYAVSEPRFRYMQNYFSRHLSTKQKQAFDKELRIRVAGSLLQWSQQGLSPQQVREEYLARFAGDKKGEK